MPASDLPSFFFPKDNFYLDYVLPNAAHPWFLEFKERVEETVGDIRTGEKIEYPQILAFSDEYTQEQRSWILDECATKYFMMREEKVNELMEQRGLGKSSFAYPHRKFYDRLNSFFSLSI